MVDGVRVTVGRQGSIAGVDLLGPAQPGTVVEVAWDGEVRGMIRLADAVKPTSAAARPTRLCISATSSGICVICTVRAA